MMPQSAPSTTAPPERHGLEFRASDPAKFPGAANDPLYGEFGRRYFPAVHGAEWSDRSFALWLDGKPVLLAECDRIGTKLGRFGHPIRLRLSDPCEDHVMRKAVRAAIGRIGEILVRESLESADIVAETSGSKLDFTGEECLNQNAEPRFVVSCGVDLALDEPALSAAIRKSYRSLVNWGRRNLSLSYVNADNPDAAAFASYRAFHQQVAGRTTRGDESWRAMFDWIAGGGGEVTLGHDSGGALVSGTMVVDGAVSAYYASGVYDRAKFDSPLGHWPLFDAILRAKRRGRAWLDLGEVPADAAAAKKERDIAFFKRGFATELSGRVVWTLRSPGSGAAG